MDDANFATTLSVRARAQPGKAALVQQSPGRRGWRSISFADLESLVNRYTCGLARQGVCQGDRVLYLLPPSIDAYAVFYALLRLRAVPVLIDPRIGLSRLLTCIAAAGARVVVGVSLVHALRTLVRRPFIDSEVSITAGRRWFWGGPRLADCLADDGDAPVARTAPGDASFLPFTSGSTGSAKPVFYDHAMLQRQAQVMHEVCGWSEGMRIVMGYAPFVPYALADGLTVILPDIDFSAPARADPARVVDAVTRWKAQCAFASPIIWTRLSRYCERRRITLPTLERAVTAGAPVPIDLHRRLRGILPPEGQLYTPYGATEVMPVTTTNTSELVETWTQTRLGYGTSVGRPLSGVEVEIIRVTDDPIPVWTDDLRRAEGSLGEIVVGGGLVSPRYLNRPDETALAKIRRNGSVLHRTGDLGRRDADGRLWFCGRKAHRVETKEGTLAPVALENIFNEHPAVFRTAAVGIGARGAESVVVVVELEAGQVFSSQLEAELAERTTGTCFQGLVSRFLPHRGFPVDPRHNSKIRRDELAAWAVNVLGG